MDSTISDSTNLSVFDNQGLSEVQAQVCTLLATGKTIEAACHLAGITEYRYTKWLVELPAFERSVRSARAILIDRRMDNAGHVARTEPDVNRARLIIDTDKWLASKLIPKVYGDRLDVNVTATIDISDARQLARQRVFVRPMCDPGDVIDAQVIESIDNSLALPIDTQSIAPDIFT